MLPNSLMDVEFFLMLQNLLDSNMLLPIAYYGLKYVVLAYEKLKTKKILTNVKSNLIQELEGIKSSSG
jgi:hypothetical protein